MPLVDSSSIFDFDASWSAKSRIAFSVACRRGWPVDCRVSTARNPSSPSSPGGGGIYAATGNFAFSKKTRCSLDTKLTSPLSLPLRASCTTLLTPSSYGCINMHVESPWGLSLLSEILAIEARASVSFAILSCLTSNQAVF